MFFSPQELAEDRADFAELLSDACIITKPGEPVPGVDYFNNDTGQYDYPDRVVVYEGPCRLQVKVDINSNVVETTAGEKEWTYLTSQLQLPVIGSELVDVDHVCEITASEYDEALIGVLLNITGPYRKTVATYRRFRVRELVA